MHDTRKPYTKPEDLVCPKCGATAINIDIRLVTITGPPEYLRWECKRCGYYEHTKPVDAKDAEDQIIQEKEKK